MHRNLGVVAHRGFEPISGDVKLLIDGVSTEQLTSVRAISDLIGELRTEMSAGRRAFAG
jgi:hypothetical protein